MGTVLIPRQLIGQILITKQGWCCSIFLTRTMTEHASCLTYPLVLTYPLMSSGQTVSEFAHIVGIIGHALEDRSGQAYQLQWLPAYTILLTSITVLTWES